MRFIVGSVLSALSFAASAGTSLVCPDAYPTSLLAATGVPSGWDGIAHVAGLRLVLASAGMVAGRPDRQIQALLRGDEKKTRNGYTATYSGLTRSPEPQGKWIFCAYGAGGDVQLLHRVPDDTETCVVDARRNVQHGYDIRITCRAQP